VHDGSVTYGAVAESFDYPLVELAKVLA